MYTIYYTSFFLTTTIFLKCLQLWKWVKNLKVSWLQNAWFNLVKIVNASILWRSSTHQSCEDRQCINLAKIVNVSILWRSSTYQSCEDRHRINLAKIVNVSILWRSSPYQSCEDHQRINLAKIINVSILRRSSMYQSCEDLFWSSTYKSPDTKEINDHYK